jgi:hypothetical protein
MELRKVITTFNSEDDYINLASMNSTVTPRAVDERYSAKGLKAGSHPEGYRREHG